MSTIKQAEQYFQQGSYAQAGQIYQQLLMADRQNIEAMMGLGHVALAMHSYQRAYDIFQRCLALNTQLPQLYLSLAQACVYLNLFDRAEKALLDAYQLNNTYQPTLQQIASFYAESGDYQRCLHYIKKWRGIAPKSIAAFALLVRIKQLSLDDANDSNAAYIACMLAKLAIDEKMTTRNTGNLLISKDEQVSLHYSFAELYHSAENYQQAFFHFSEANRLQREDIDFSVDDMRGYFQQLVETFAQSLFTDRNQSTLAENTLTPIFIVGQPRSGSTLLEQMLVGHSQIATGGELPFMAGDIAQGIYQLTGHEFPAGAKLLNSRQCQQLADHYLKNLQSLAPSSSHIIDKMPANYQSIGLIKLLMPHAKIIHISRDAVDVSWSIFRNYFQALEPYFCSLPEIAQYHQLYQNVMAHWQTTLPDFFHTVTYENLVANPEQELKKILTFCQLDYQKSCLDFSKEQRHIRTLSDTQLRSGIDNTRSKSWLPYKEFLAPLFDTHQ